MFDALFAGDTDSALRARASAPPPPPQPVGLFSGFWGAALRGPAAGLFEVADLPVRAAERELETRIRGESGRLPPIDRNRAREDLRLADVTGFNRDLPRTPIADGVRQALTPDPQTTGAAGQFAFGALSLLTQAGLFSLAGGPVFGAAATGVAQGAGEAERLQAQGVDTLTAAQAGAVRAVATGASLAAPVAGSTLLRSLGIVAAAGPGAFVAEQTAIRAILDNADYSDLARQYDPLDMAGLVTSVVVPGLFAAGVHGMRGLRARAEQHAEAASPQQQTGPKVTLPPDAEPAARTLALKRAVESSAPVRDQTNPDAQTAHQRALDEVHDQVNRGEPIAPRSAQVDPDVASRVEARVADAIASEVRALDTAYSRVLDNPVGPADDPLVRLTSERIGEVVVERGPAWDRGEAEIKVGGYGLVKIIWKHGERSPTPPEFQVTREDVLRLPEILRDYAPVSERGPGNTIAWQVQRADGKRVIYVVKRFSATDDMRHVVTVYVNDGRSAKVRDMPLSQKVSSLPGSRGGGFSPRPAAAGTADTGSGSSSTIARPSGQASATDTSVPRPAGESIDMAAARQAVAADPALEVAFGVDAEGKVIRMTAADALAQADAEVAQAQADTRAFDAAVACAIRTGDLQ